MFSKAHTKNLIIASALVFSTFGTAQLIGSQEAQALHNCGGLNKKACKISHRGPRCQKGLKVKKKICVAKKTNVNKIMRKRARAIIKQTKAQRKMLKKIRKCVSKRSTRKQFKVALKKKNPNVAYKVVSKCFSSRTMGNLRSVPRGIRIEANSKTFNTMTVGIGGGGVGGFGGGGSLGIVINLNKAGSNVRFYTTGEATKGLGLAVGADVQVGLSTSKMPSRSKKELGSSIVFAGKFVAGGGVSVDFNRYAGKLINPVNVAFEGFAISGGAGVGIEIGTKHNTKTKIW